MPFDVAPLLGRERVGEWLTGPSSVGRGAHVSPKIEVPDKREQVDEVAATQWASHRVHQVDEVVVYSRCQPVDLGVIVAVFGQVQKTLAKRLRAFEVVCQGLQQLSGADRTLLKEESFQREQRISGRCGSDKGDRVVIVDGASIRDVAPAGDAVVCQCRPTGLRPCLSLGQFAAIGLVDHTAREEVHLFAVGLIEVIK